jgi:hypothetical protein
MSLLAYLESQKFHPDASHVSPDYRDGYNHALQTVINRIRIEQALSASGMQGMEAPSVYEQRLRAVLNVVQRYLPPDGIDQDVAMSEITGLVDPWPGAAATSPNEGGKQA